ncbi:YihY/virulence factor BrkB family protein [Nocardioides caldifontis]|uniref:YihY/virulence factor BrkB family protein n=1 Tax=Nocardioides caldifontis TaxID=2588938 RepID=UPI001939536F|nr:YihY/virulence factor BrkB family protein [Nocardioides caldifontis]
MSLFRRSGKGDKVKSGRSDKAVPDPDAPGKPESPADLEKPSWKYVGRKVLREFSDDQCTDQAAALTYYAVLAMFPAILALMSILGLVGQAGKAVDTVLSVLEPLVAPSTLETIEPVIRDLATSQGAGLTFVIGLAGALWSASGYVGAFGRAMNRVYEIEEGRPFWKLRPLMLLITLVAVTLSALVLVMLVVSGPLAEAIGNEVGLGEAAVTAWQWAKWPVLLLMVMLAVALLYYATPNVKQPKFKWISVGAACAIVIWVIASVAFAFYVANFGNYNKTYGSLAGVIVALLWLWITNLALLLGAEIDSELERGRELQAGIPAEEELQLPARDTRNIEKAREKEQKDIEMGRAIREQADPDGDVAAQYPDSTDTPSGRN